MHNELEEAAHMSYINPERKTQKDRQTRMQTGGQQNRHRDWDIHSETDEATKQRQESDASAYTQ